MHTHICICGKSMKDEAENLRRVRGVYWRFRGRKGKEKCNYNLKRRVVVV